MVEFLKIVIFLLLPANNLIEAPLGKSKKIPKRGSVSPSWAEGDIKAKMRGRNEEWINMAAPRNLWKTPDKGRGKLGKAGSGPVGRSGAQWGGGLFSPDFKRRKHTSSMEIKSVFPSGSQSRCVKRHCVLSVWQQMLWWRRCLSQVRWGKWTYRSLSPHRLPE